MVVVIKMLLCTVVLIVFLAVPLNAKYYEGTYKIPEPEIQAFVPKGFRVSIEDAPGIRLFAFHGNINRELRDLEAGVFSRDVLHKQNGKWTFEDRNARLEVGDIIHYWLFVIKDDLGYRLDDGLFTVTELTNSPFPTSRPTRRPPNRRPPPNKDSSEESQESCRPTNEPSTSAATPSQNNDRDTYLRICEQTVLNATQGLLTLQAQADLLRDKNQQLTGLLEKYADSRKLTLSGRIPVDDEPAMTVRFIIREKLELNPDVIDAVRNSDNSITFEVATLTEKLDILQAAKDNLKNSKIVIA